MKSLKCFLNLIVIKDLCFLFEIFISVSKARGEKSCIFCLYKEEANCENWINYEGAHLKNHSSIHQKWQLYFVAVECHADLCTVEKNTIL